MILIFQRKIIRATESVETKITGIIDGQHYEVGQVTFPNKQSWTKFWGTIQRGAISVPEMDVRMENVPDVEPVITSEIPPVDSKPEKLGGSLGNAK